MFDLLHLHRRGLGRVVCLALSSCAAVPVHATTATPAPLPGMCTQEHVAERGEPAPCLGVLVPPADALAGATCLDADLPTCRRLRRRAADVHRLEVAQLARRVSESDARAARWEALARQPCPQAVTRVVERSRGAPAWVAWTALAVGLLGGGLLGWKARGLTR